MLEAARGLDPWHSPNGSRVLGMTMVVNCRVQRQSSNFSNLLHNKFLLIMVLLVLAMKNYQIALILSCSVHVLCINDIIIVVVIK